MAARPRGPHRSLQGLRFNSQQDERHWAVVSQGVIPFDVILKSIPLAAALDIDRSSRPVRRLSVIQVRDDDGSDPGWSCGHGNKWLDPGYILKVETIGFALRLAKDCGRVKVFILISGTVEDMANRK